MYYGTMLIKVIQGKFWKVFGYFSKHRRHKANTQKAHDWYEKYNLGF